MTVLESIEREGGLQGWIKAKLLPRLYIKARHAQDNGTRTTQKRTALHMTTRGHVTMTPTPYMLSEALYWETEKWTMVVRLRVAIVCVLCRPECAPCSFPCPSRPRATRPSKCKALVGQGLPNGKTADQAIKPSR